MSSQCNGSHTRKVSTTVLKLNNVPVTSQIFGCKLTMMSVHLIVVSNEIDRAPRCFHFANCNLNFVPRPSSRSAWMVRDSRRRHDGIHTIQVVAVNAVRHTMSCDAGNSNTKWEPVPFLFCIITPVCSNKKIIFMKKINLRKKLTLFIV